MRRRSGTGLGAFPRDGLAWRVLWVALAGLVVVLPALDLAWGEVPRHGQPCPLHSNLIVAPAGVTPEEPLESSAQVPSDPVRSPASFAPSIFIPPRP